MKERSADFLRPLTSSIVLLLYFDTVSIRGTFWGTDCRIIICSQVRDPLQKISSDL